MRWVFFALLVFNLAYGAWHLTQYIMQPDVSQQVAQQQQPVHAPVSLHVVTGSQVPVATKSNKGGAAAQKMAAKQLCTVVGPWQEAADARATEVDLGELANQASVHAVSIHKQGLVWVYLPAYPSRDAALKVLQKLQRKGVDSFITDDGDQPNAISLGYFHNHDSALGLQQRMRQAGFNAKIRTTQHDITEYWLYLGQVPFSKLQSYMADHDDLSLNKVACSSSDGAVGALTADRPLQSTGSSY